jgi:hypothetical protein
MNGSMYNFRQRIATRLSYIAIGITRRAWSRANFINSIAKRIRPANPDDEIVF